MKNLKKMISIKFKTVVAFGVGGVAVFGIEYVGETLGWLAKFYFFTL